jgi:uncharacterized protein (DUF433 family)
MDPHRPGPADARLRDSGVPLWALISYLQRAVGGEVAQAAEDYAVPVEAVEAALAYYQQSEQHRQLIDARIALNAA